MPPEEGLLVQLACVLLLALLMSVTARAADEAPATRPAPAVRIVLAGDSTVTDKAGWGVGFAELLAADVQLLNHARGGRSSRTFRDNDLWSNVLKTKADYVLIQFGHNDEPGTDRSTDRETEFPVNMRRYVAEARAAGMRPVLVTPLVRRQFKEDGMIHSSLARHAEIVREIARDLRVPLVDLHDRSLAVCNALGPDVCTALMSQNKPNGGYDGTHLTRAGSMIMGAIVADELKRAVPELARHTRDIPKASVVAPK
jgi:pectinesterase